MFFVRFCMGNDLKMRIIQAPGNWIGAGRGLVFFLLEPLLEFILCVGRQSRSKMGLSEARVWAGLPLPISPSLAALFPERGCPEVFV